jgi:hypothetical protein
MFHLLLFFFQKIYGKMVLANKSVLPFRLDIGLPMMIWKLLAKFWSGFKTRAQLPSYAAWAPDSMKILFGVYGRNLAIF